MTFKEYYKRNKFTTENCLKICGLIFTSIYVVIAIISGFKSQSFLESLKMFLILFFLGNGLGIFIFLLAILTSYKQTNSIEKLYASIPEIIKDKYGFLISVKNQNPRYNFMQFEILSTKTEIPILIGYFKGKKEIKVSIVNNLIGIVNFQKLMLDIQKKYRKNRIILNGHGFSKLIKFKDWKKINESIFDQVFNELIEISKQENIETFKRNIE